MKIALPVRNGYLEGNIESACFIAIIEITGKIAALRKIVRLASFEKEFEGLAMLLKEEGVDTVIVGDISPGALEFFNLNGLKVIPGASGEMGEVAYSYLKRR